MVVITGDCRLDHSNAYRGFSYASGAGATFRRDLRNHFFTVGARADSAGCALKLFGSGGICRHYMARLREKII